MPAKETRIITHPSLASDYAVVSMPQTAWYWLDDLVKTQFPSGGYKALVQTFGDTSGCPQNLSSRLRAKAQEHCEKQMAEFYNLANDNAPAGGYGDLKSNPACPDTPDLSARMPGVYRLFRFMPHATYLTTVWERRNYHLRGSQV
jgi:hypothetical protein